MYSEKVMSIFNNIKNAGMLRGANGVGSAVDEDCGDIIKLYLLVEDGKITNATFKAFGGVAIITVASVIADNIINKDVDDAEGMTFKDVMREIGELPAKKQYAISLGLKSLSSAIMNYRKNLEKEIK